MSDRIVFLHDDDPFPNPKFGPAQDPIAFGADLSVERLKMAYQQGIFPWPLDDNLPIPWWSVDPRGILFFENLHIPRSLKKRIRNTGFRVTLDQSFEKVIRSCAEPRDDGSFGWITPKMCSAYIAFHEAGYAHSVETWLNDELVGGLYGVSLGKIFFGESMFTRVSDASKVALVSLVHELSKQGFYFIECQMITEVIANLGGRYISRPAFLQLLNYFLKFETKRESWQSENDIIPNI